MLCFAVLGPLTVTRDGCAVHVNGPKLRVLLAALLLRANAVVPVSAIMRRLWDDEPPPAGRKTVQMYVLRLRRVLGDDALIETHPDGYSIRVRPDALDLTCFRDAVRAARAAVPHEELSLLRRALDCWRGPILDDLTFSESLHREDVPPLAEELLRAQERFFDVSLELGRHGDVVGDLIRVTELHPWHEAFWAQLVTALHRTGRRADALHTYRTVRRRFADELGVEPGTRLQQAHQAALMADDAVPPPPAVAQLPGDVGRFIGRAGEIAHLDALAAGGGDRTVVLSGPPGVGKTTLAVHVAHRWRGRFPDGQLYVNLQGFSADPPLSASTALTRFLGALGVTRDRVPVEVEEQSALLRSALTGRRMLLLLDNAADADQVRPLLPGQSGCLTLVTSRYDLRGLVVNPGATGVALDVLTHDDSRAVLADVLGPARVAAEADALSELARTCAHLPLALRIAGANLAADPGCTIADYTTELTTRGRLAGLAIDGDERSAVRAAFDQSYLRLAPADQSLFRLLGVVPGPDIGVSAAAALAGVEVGAARRAFDRLVAAGLLHRTAPGRCGSHDLIREYAAGLAQENGVDVEPALARLSAYYLERAAAAARLAFPAAVDRALVELETNLAGAAATGPAEAEAVRWLDEERPNLLALLTWSATRPAVQRHAWRLVEVLHGYLHARGHTGEAVAGCLAALRAARAAGDDQACISVLDLLGQIRHYLGEFDHATECHQQVLTIARALGDADAESEALRNLGRQVLQQGDPVRAARFHREALAISRATGNLNVQARTLNSLGVALFNSGAVLDAAEVHEQAIALAREIGHRETLHRCLNGRGMDRWALGLLDESAADHEQVLAYCRQAGQAVGEVSSLMCLAEVHLDAGRLDQAVALTDQAFAVLRGLAEQSATEANIMTVVAGVHHRRGDLAAAAATFGKVLELSREMGFGSGEKCALVGLAGVHRDLGDPRTARAHAREVLTLMRASGQLLLEADALIELAAAQRDLGEPARETAQEAVEVATRQGRRLVERRARRLLAGLGD